jgi:CRISPR/Cas system-associated exonuclease Cas4 (RecB family)
MLTNKYNLSDAIFEILKGEKRKQKPLNRYSVTQLLGNIREQILSETEEPVEDVSDYFSAFLGNCVHYYMEHHTTGKNELHIETEFNGNVISGIIDNFEDGIITDYKTKKCLDDDYESAVKQIKMYAWILRRNGVIADKGRIIIIRKDWSKMKNISPIETFEFVINSFDIEQAEEYIKERIRLFEEGRKTLPLCSDEDKWKEPDTWAVYSFRGDSRAKKIFASKEEAEAYSDGKMFVDHRPGRCLKCDSFCSFSKICSILLNQEKNK